MFVGVDKFKFKSQVKPGDTLTLEAEMLQMRMNIGKAKVKASVDGKMVAGGEISFAIV